jgi:hypothetical protein
MTDLFLPAGAPTGRWPQALQRPDGDVEVTWTGWADGSFLLHDGTAGCDPVPPWGPHDPILEIAPIRGGRAYAAFPAIASSSGDATIEVFNVDHAPCGTFTVPVTDRAKLSIGRDGTVFVVSGAGPAGQPISAATCRGTVQCTWRWWPGLLGSERAGP